MRIHHDTYGFFFQSAHESESVLTQQEQGLTRTRSFLNVLADQLSSVLLNPWAVDRLPVTNIAIFTA
ncbi:hypothetical protein M378DRAFT_165097 [Amanita muscaria Koide BX008]|uniref:Uncharacterized protein n=1 Tax=Amanita muscaria (strain Koide BX008) TaxID=946122 RepID=A0A0C2X1J5_AMAMK|nr:hypothetical protein M378DRAFT_165097 [Amanita muscaria Koide BX008]